MEALLKLQPDVTLTEWMKEKGLESEDPVATIIDYYAYLDLLHVPNLSDELHDRVFGDKDILSNIVSMCPLYSLPSLALLNKRCYELLSEYINNVPCNNSNGYYLFDAIETMDWYHITHSISSKRTSESDYADLAASRGYELILPKAELVTKEDRFRLLHAVAASSDCSDRYYNLFVKLFVEFEDIHPGSLTGVSLTLSCCQSGDLRIFERVYKAVVNNGCGSQLSGIMPLNVMPHIAYTNRLSFFSILPRPNPLSYSR